MPRKTPSQKSVCYFLVCDGRLKIGFTTRYHGRMLEYRNKHSSVEILGKIPGDRKKERSLHSRFSAFGISGEWFKDEPATRDLVAEILQEPHEVPKEFDHDWFGRMVRELFPINPGKRLHEITGLNERSCYRYVHSGLRVPHEAMTKLLRSEYGREFLEIVMRGTTRKWWQKYADKQAEAARSMVRGMESL